MATDHRFGAFFPILMPTGVPMSNVTYKYSERVASEIDRGIKAGLKMAVIHDSLLRLAETPKSRAMFFEKYKDQIAKSRSEYQIWLGDTARTRIEEGSDKILELALRSKAGWNPSLKIEEADAEDSEEVTALDKLARLLGKDFDQKPEEDK
jgi:hypothetical protein